MTSSSVDKKSIVFTWTAPNNRGDSVTEYQVAIFSMRFNTYITSLTLCDYTYPNTTCSILHTTVLSTLGYSPGDIVKAKSRAKNSYGWSEWSLENVSGERAQGKPKAPTLTSLVNGADKT